MLVCFFLLSIDPLQADVPVRKEQLIFSILAFNGRDYSGTFSGEDSDTIYLMANVDNFLSVRKTLVYFWSITQELKTDPETLNQVFTGTLELQAKGQKSRFIEMVDHTFYNIQGEYELNWKVDTGEAAKAAYQKYRNIVDAYWKAVEEYKRKRAAFDALMSEFSIQIAELRKSGKDFSTLLEQLQNMESPQPPESPEDYIMPPSPVQKGFLLNLPEGEYTIRFINDDGTIMEGSERAVITFKQRREDGIGLEVIPEDKWTRPVESKTPFSILYVDGTTDLYLRPYFENEYNDLYYEKMRKNDSKGNPNLMKWVRIQQVPRAQIELTHLDRNTEMILENPFYVEQVKGAALGYKIVPYEPEGPHKGKNPSLKAFHIPIHPDDKVLRLRVQDKTGRYLAGSNRQIHIVSQTRLNIILLVIALLPILVMIIVRARRARVYTQNESYFLY